MARPAQSKNTRRRPVPRDKRWAGQGPENVRPALIYALLLTCILAIGAGVIRLIHNTTPELSGFEPVAQAQTDPDAATTSDQARIPTSVALMQSQGWIAPAALELYDPKTQQRRQSDLPPEIAVVPEVLSDVKPMAVPEQQAYRAPPPPPDATSIFSSPQIGAGRSQLALPPLRQRGGNQPPQQFDAQGNPVVIGPSGEAVIVQGDPNLPTRQTVGQIGVMIDGLPVQRPQIQPQAAQDQTTQPPAAPATTQPPTAPIASLGARPGVTDKPAPSTLVEAQAECVRFGFIARIACKDRIRDRFCAGRWNKSADCRRENENAF